MKTKILCLVFITGLMHATTFAQPRIRSQKVFGGSSDDNFSCMDLTKDGGYILGGYSESRVSGNKTDKSRGGHDYWIVKLDSAGKIQWDKTIGGIDEDILTSIQQTSDAGYILGGFSRSNKSGEKTENGRGFWDYWVVKLDSAGKIQWDKTLGGNNVDRLTSLQQTDDEGYVLGGYSYSDKSGEKTENRRGDDGSDDYWIVKLDSKGNIQWDKTIGGNELDELQSLKQTKDGGYILGGTSYSNKSFEKTENSRGYNDYWVVKLDNTGKIQWDKTVGGSFIEYFFSLEQTKDAGYILGGESFSGTSGDKTENSRGIGDYWVVKLNDQGKIEWDKTVGGFDWDVLSSLQQTSDDGYILGGWSRSFKSYDKTENGRGYFDYWVIKLAKTGKIQWDKTIGGSLNDGEGEVLDDGSGSAGLVVAKEIEKDRYVVGGSSGSRISGDKKRRSRGSYDYWLVALDARGISNTSVTSSNQQSLVIPNVVSNKGFSIYPNPAKDILHIQTNSKATFSLTNQAGKILLTKTIEGNGVISVAGVPAGLYYLKNNSTGKVQKVIVSK